MKKTTQKWIVVGVLIAALFFIGSLIVMFVTNETVYQDRGVPREGPAENPASPGDTTVNVIDEDDAGIPEPDPAEVPEPEPARIPNG